MMYLLETVNLCLAICLCAMCSRSDICSGTIHNKTLAVFTAGAVLIDIVYYGFLARDLLWDFLANLTIIVAVSLYLFYSHYFAGGDCKMTMVLALLYPARFYVEYKNSIVTLIFAIGVSIFTGYIYLLGDSVKAILMKKTRITVKYLKAFLSDFLKSYISALIYIALLNCVFLILERIGISINVWISRCACMLIAWCIGRYPVFKKNIFLVSILAMTAAISVIVRTVPISFRPENYALVLILLLCQLTIRTAIYENVRVEQLRRGMILTALSSCLMQTSITKGLPGISTEDLKSRLTDEQIQSIKIWAKATHTDELTVVKKIPFAIFLSIGFISYFILWRILVWG